MASTTPLLELAKAVGRKARTLIPRSENQVMGSNGHRPKWVKEKTSLFLQLQLAAQRSSSGAAEVRKFVLDLKLDIQFDKPGREREYDEALKKALSARGITQEKLEGMLLDLDKAKRSKKREHKDGTSLTPLEKLEGNAKNAIRYEIGNCVECASLAFVMFMEYKGPSKGSDLPQLDAVAGKRPMVEKACVSNPGDHHFVLINRNTSIPIEAIDQWSTDDVIICDGWWFKDGDAKMLSGHTHGLRQEILENKAGLQVSLALPLGSGHSSHFQSKYPNVNFLENEAVVTKAQLNK